MADCEAFEIFSSYLKQRYDDKSISGVISVSDKERIISHLLGNEDQDCYFRQRVKEQEYTLEFKGDDGQSVELVRPNRTGRKEANSQLKVPSPDEYFGIIERIHAETGHEGVNRTHYAILKEYVLLPRTAVRKFVSLCVLCQNKRSDRLKLGIENKKKKLERQEQKEREKQRDIDSNDIYSYSDKDTDSDTDADSDTDTDKNKQRKRKAADSDVNTDKDKSKNGNKKKKTGDTVKDKNTNKKNAKKGDADKDANKNKTKGQSKNKAETRTVVNADKDKSKGKTKMKSPKRASPKALVQFIVLPAEEPDWPAGVVMAQACRACTAVLQVFKQDEYVIKFTSNLDDMQTEILESKDEEETTTLSTKLKDNDIDHILWMKSASNHATCLATKPYPRSQILKHFKKLKKLK